MDEVMKIIKDTNMYVCASIDGKGVHIGRIKDIGYDADGTPVLEIDIDKLSVTGGINNEN